MPLLLNFILFTSILYFAYLLLFKKLSFFSTNRWVLLAIPMFSLAIPLAAPFFKDPVLQATGFNTNLIPIDIQVNGNRADTNSTTAYNYWFIIYLLGLGFGLFSLARGLFKVKKTIAQSTSEIEGPYQVLFSDGLENPFTFFRHIVLPENLRESNSLETIVYHETVHAHELHSIDNIYYATLSAVFWFNPFIHLLAKELRQTHECIADRQALQKTSREAYAQLLLSSTFGSEVILPANPFFNSSLIKTRITMIYKKKSPKWLRATYLVLLPLMGLLTLHACDKSSESANQELQEQKAVTVQEVEQLPTFSNCDANASKDEQIQCFQQGIVKHISENLKYPEDAKSEELAGKVFVSFIINDQGNVSEATVIKGISFEEGTEITESMKAAAEVLESYAVTIVQSLPKTSPARLNGEKVSMKFTLPINYAWE